MKNHTPTPWKVGNGKYVGESIWHGENIKIAEGLLLTDSEHIVKCVNAHEELVEALKSVSDLVWHTDNSGRTEQDYADAKTKMEQALKKAGEL